MRELGAYFTIKRLIPEASVTTSPSAVVIDRLLGAANLYDGVAFGMHVGAGGITFDDTNYIALKLEHSDDNVSYSVIDPVDAALGRSVTGVAPWFGQAADSNGFVRLINTAHASADADPFKVSYVGDKRYVRSTIVLGGTHGVGTLVGLCGLLGFPQLTPAP